VLVDDADAVADAVHHGGEQAGLAPHLRLGAAGLRHRPLNLPLQPGARGGQHVDERGEQDAQRDAGPADAGVEVAGGAGQRRPVGGHPQDPFLVGEGQDDLAVQLATGRRGRLTDRAVGADETRQRGRITGRVHRDVEPVGGGGQHSGHQGGGAHADHEPAEELPRGVDHRSGEHDRPLLPLLWQPPVAEQDVGRRHGGPADGAGLQDRGRGLRRHTDVDSGHHGGAVEAHLDDAEQVLGRPARAGPGRPQDQPVDALCPPVRLGRGHRLGRGRHHERGGRHAP
jgi:hypothetical protein